MNKRGAFFFILDVFIGSMILLVTIILILGYMNRTTSLSGVEQQAELLKSDIFDTEVSQVGSDNVALQTLRAANDVPYFTASVDEYIYYLILEGRTIDAAQVVEGIVNGVPGQYGVEYVILTDPETVVYSRNDVSKDDSETMYSVRALTLTRSDFKTVSEPIVTEVRVWQ